jgi:Holliday junction resolvase-like predicted endonuclease
MQKNNVREIGRKYEKYAMKRLSKLGFRNIKWATKHKYLPYDITAEKDGKKFYIEVKYGRRISH